MKSRVLVSTILAGLLLFSGCQSSKEPSVSNNTTNEPPTTELSINDDPVSEDTPKVVSTNENLKITPRNSDSDGTVNTWSVEVTLPNGEIVDVIDLFLPNSNPEDITISFTEAGDYTLVLSVTDDSGDTTIQNYTITVQEPPQNTQASNNNPPVINSSSTSIDGKEDRIEVLSGDRVWFNGSATDPDGDELIYSWGTPTNKYLTVVGESTPNFDTALYYWVQYDNGEVEDEVKEDGKITYKKTLRVSDGKGGVATKDFFVDVRSRNQDATSNQPPEVNLVDPEPVMYGATLPTISAGSTGENPPVVDPDGIAYYFKWMDADGNVLKDANDNNISGPWVTSYQPENLSPGSHTFILEVTDNEGATTRDSVTIQVITGATGSTGGSN